MRLRFGPVTERPARGANEGRVPWGHRRDDIARRDWRLPPASPRWTVDPASAQPNEPPRSCRKSTSPTPAWSAGRAAPGAASRRAPAPRSTAEAPGGQPPAASGIVTGTIITGASSTVITAQEIERSPGQTLQDVLAREPGIQVRSLFGRVNGASTTVDMRGFGAAGHLQHAGADQRPPAQRHRHRRRRFQRHPARTASSGSRSPAAIPAPCSMATARSAASSTSSPRTAWTCRRRRACRRASARSTTCEGNLSANTSASNIGRASSRRRCTPTRSAPTAIARTTSSRQKNAVGDFRWTDGRDTSAYLNVSADNQHLGLPGGRRVTLTSSELVTNRRGAATPFDFAEKKGINATLGVTHMLWQGTELVVDGGVRHKKQEAGLLQRVRLPPSIPASRPNLTLAVGDAAAPEPAHDRRRARQADHRHRRLSFDLRFRPQPGISAIRRSTATTSSRPPPPPISRKRSRCGPTPTSPSARASSSNAISARDRWRSECAAAGCSPVPAQGLPFDGSETQYAWHIGVEHRVTREVAFFGRAARSLPACPMSTSAWQLAVRRADRASISRPRPRTTSKPASAPTPGRSPGRSAATIMDAAERAASSARRPSPTPTSIRRGATASRTS